MALGNRHVKLDSRTARLKLPSRHAAYWTLISPNCSLGYRRGEGSVCGVWIAKYSPSEGRRVQTRIAAADDRMSADDVLCLDFFQARRKALEWFPVAVQIATGEISRRQGYAVRDACADYLEHLYGRSKSLQVTRYMVNANIVPVLGDKLVEKLTRTVIENWHKELARTARRKPRNGLESASEEAIRRRKDTANRNLVVLKAALNFALAQGKVACNGVAWKTASVFKGVGSVRTGFLSDSEARRLVDGCEPEFRCLVEAALYSGCRYSEIASLLVRDFDPISSTLLIAESKAGRSRRVYLDSEARLFFESVTTDRLGSEPIFQLQGKKWGKDSAQGMMEIACKAAGIQNTTFHELRHTAASRWARSGLSLHEIAAQLGHADIRMTLRYAHLCRQTLADKMKILPGLGLATRPLQQESIQ